MYLITGAGLISHLLEWWRRDQHDLFNERLRGAAEMIGWVEVQLVLPLDDKLMQMWSTTVNRLPRREKSPTIRTCCNLSWTSRKRWDGNIPWADRAGRKDATSSFLAAKLSSPLPSHHMNGGMGTCRKDLEYVSQQACNVSVRWLMHALLRPKPAV